MKFIRTKIKPLKPKVGSIVRIISDLKDGYDYNIFCNTDMIRQAGKKAKIIIIKKGYDPRMTRYYLDITNRYGYAWTDDMFKVIG